MIRSIFTIPCNTKIFVLTSLLICLLLTGQSLAGQPSGGPYGPVPQKFNLPETYGRFIYTAPDGNADSQGISPESPTSLDNAVKLATAGDAIILRGGTYRTGNLVFNQGILFQAYDNELPVLKGTYVASDWKNLGNGLWTTHWDYLFPMEPQGWWHRDRSGKQTPLHRFNNDMVFFDGEFLQSAAYEGEVNENTFYIDYETGTVYIGQDPTNHLVEITAFDVAMLRTTDTVDGKKPDKAGPTIRGISFTQYAYRAIEIEGFDPDGISAEAAHGKDVVGTTIEHCSISYCSRVAAYLRGDSLTMRHCHISHTSTEGIFLLASSDALFEKNIFEENNIEHIDGYYPAAVKIFNQCYRVSCNDNLIRNLPWSNGIWYDVGNVDGVFTNNWVENVGFNTFTINRENLWPSQNGFFFEISKGIVCAGNVFVNCDHGLMILNSSGAKIWNNTFVNSMLTIGRTNRSAVGDHFDWHPATGPDVDERTGHVVKNNLIAADPTFKRPLVFIWQENKLCGTLNDPQPEGLDFNAYIRNATVPGQDLLLWGPSGTGSPCTKAYKSLEEFRAENEYFSKNSSEYLYQNIPVFKGAHLNNFHLSQDSPVIGKGTDIPEKIRNLLREYSENPYVGAYPPQ
ncbi:MAG: right-handed parallel beta-helix repeat-containing protein [Bacteroidales bacterium]|nr:right-handed parallel beta-helix repeat-containing protein [Bacteroidales bacterium]